MKNLKDAINKLVSAINDFYTNTTGAANDLSGEALKEFQFLNNQVIKTKEAAETFIKKQLKE